LPGAVLDAPLDIDLVAFLAVSLSDIRQTRTLVVPQNHPVPLGFLLLFARLILPTPTGGKRQRRHPGTVGGAAHFGVRPEISDQNDFVQATAHRLLRGSRGPTGEWTRLKYRTRKLFSQANLRDQ